MLDEKNDNLQDKVEDGANSEPTQENKIEQESIEKTIKVDTIDNAVEITSEKNKVIVEEEVEDADLTENKSESEVVDEIDDHLAKASEKNETIVEEAKVNYEAMSLESLVEELEKLIQTNEVHKINNQVNAIKSAFSGIFSKLLAEKKATFLENEGESIDFSYSNPSKIKFNKLISEFKDERTKYYKSLESELSGNLELRVQVIDQLKDLIENADSKTMYSKFRDLQERWKKIGPVVREKYSDTWRTYHHHVERFYDLLHLSNDYRDLDFKHNLEEKLKLVVRVDALDLEKDVNVAFKKLQDIHKVWKEDLGPVAREKRDELWDIFSAATKKIHDRRHDYFRDLRSKYDENAEKKKVIIEEIDAYDPTGNVSHKDWQSSIKIIDDLRNQFFKIGKVSRSDNEKIWNKFKDATHKFNIEKNKYYKDLKSVQQVNLDMKMKLIAQAEALKTSEEWESATEVMKKIQADWKEIGHVPRKYSDKIWKQFKNACNQYFDSYHEYKNSGSKEEQEVLSKKKAMLDEVRAKIDDTAELALETINQIVAEWHDLGKVPHGMRHVESKFSKLVDRLYSKLSIDPSKIELIKFKNQMESLVAQNNYRKLDGEQIFLRKKIDELIREQKQLENNISFFSNAKDDNPLLKNVRNSINEIGSKLDLLKGKLSILKKLEY